MINYFRNILKKFYFIRLIKSKLPTYDYLSTFLIKNYDIIIAFFTDNNLYKLHIEINRIFAQQKKEWPHYAYGFGYHYQGWKKIKITGRRETDLRFKNYQIEKYLKNNFCVLDVGSNTGFFSIKLSKFVKQIDCIEWNPFLSRIGMLVSNYLKVYNINFIDNDIINYNFEKKYDLILSFASHNTDDKGNAVDLEVFFNKINSLLNNKSIFIFESHPQDIHDKNFLNFIENYKGFNIIRKSILTDRPKIENEYRLFIIMEKNEIT